MMMLPLLFLASIPAAFAAAFTGGPESTEQVVRESANGEFISRHYPPGAFKRGEQGKVAFRLTVEPDGSLGTCDVTESSGFASLDKETCEVLLRYARLKPVRSSDGRAIRAVQSGFIVWRLPEAVSRMASASSKTMPKPDQVICKRTQATGSLIQKTKQCMTRAEWVRTAREYQDQAYEMQGRGYAEDGDVSSPGTGLSCC
jgi:TonB family protein